MSDLQRLRRYSYQGEGDEIAELVNDLHWAADEIERLIADLSVTSGNLELCREGSAIMSGIHDRHVERIAELEAIIRTLYIETSDDWVQEHITEAGEAPQEVSDE